MVDAYGVHLGLLYVHALILGLGILSGTWFTARRANSYGFTADRVWDALTWEFLSGLIGARLYHVLTPTPDAGVTTQYSLEHPLEILAIWNGARAFTES